MSEPLMPQEEVNPNRLVPRTVVAAKSVDVAIVTFIDERGQQHSTLAVVGDTTAHLLEGKQLGLASRPTPVGEAVEWLRRGIFAKLGRKLK